MGELGGAEGGGVEDGVMVAEEGERVGDGGGGCGGVFGHEGELVEEDD